MAKHLLVVALLVISGLVAHGPAAQTLTFAPQAQSTTPGGPTAPTGDAKRGRELFEKTYRCYACHGFDGQTGSPRLVPMARTQEAFIAYVRKPSTPGMPKFSAAP